MILFETPKAPCCSSARHIAGAVVPAQATKSRSGFACFTCCANGVKSCADSGTSIRPTVWPCEPTIELTAA